MTIVAGKLQDVPQKTSIAVSRTVSQDYEAVNMQVIMVRPAYKSCELYLP